MWSIFTAVLTIVDAENIGTTMPVYSLIGLVSCYSFGYVIPVRDMGEIFFKENPIIYTQYEDFP